MKNDIVEIIGVYRLEKDAISEYDELMNPEKAENALIIELIVKKPPSEYDLGDFTQPTDLPRDSWQVPYAEYYFDRAGESVLSEMEPPQDSGPESRIVFFMHYLDLSRPLQTPFGDVPLKQPTDMPARLKGKIEYWEP